MAAYNHEVEIAKYLIRHGANGDIEFINGDTILMWAASNGKNEIIRQLISNGVNINIKVK